MKRRYKIIINSVLCFLLCSSLMLAVPMLFKQKSDVPSFSETSTDSTSPSDKEAVPNDFNDNGKPDSQDILEGARADALNLPRYDDTYWPGGYPPDDVGVCSDVIWRAFKNAGYDLKRMVDEDIARRPEYYTEIAVPDKNIDFRRVVNLLVFFREYAIPLTTDPDQTDEWQAGDIAVFCNKNGKPTHIGIISDMRAEDGTAFLIHNSGQPQREENALRELIIMGHFRFDASLLPKDMRFAWQE